MRLRRANLRVATRPIGSYSSDSSREYSVQPFGFELCSNMFHSPICRIYDRVSPAGRVRGAAQSYSQTCEKTQQRTQQDCPGTQSFNGIRTPRYAGILTDCTFASPVGQKCPPTRLLSQRPTTKGPTTEINDQNNREEDELRTKLGRRRRRFRGPGDAKNSACREISKWPAPVPVRSRAADP